MMKHLRWILPGFMLGLLLSLTPSCGAQKTCNASNCAGCCDAAGTCNSGNNGSFCGVSGALCRACGSNEICTLGSCTAFGQGGGGGAGGGTGGGSGGGGGSSDGGMTCANFPTCGTGTCCQMVAGSPQCVTAGTANACRLVSGICDAPCTGSQTCTSSGCASTSCSGCQAGASCIATGSQSPTQCGINGAACVVCPSGNACVNGVCTPPAPSCTAQNCASGCCQGTSCITTQSTTQCGTGGATCQSCTSGQLCSSGSCVAGSGAIGSTCTLDTQCTALGTGAFCKKTTPGGQAYWTGGHCTRPCSAQSDCPGGACASPPTGAEYGETQSVCVASCGTGGTCRTGYSCFYVTPPFNNTTTITGCWIDPPTPSGQTGAACADDSPCDAPPTFGFCQPATSTTTGAATPWVGGYCMADCTNSADPNYCGTDGLCVKGLSSSSPNNGLCLKKCTTPLSGTSNCRTNYRCTPVSTGGGMCFPNCNNPSGNCSPGFACRANGTGPLSGYCCPTDGGTSCN